MEAVWRRIWVEAEESKDIIEDPPIEQGHTEKKMKERYGEGSIFPPHQNSQQSGFANP